jgi:DNA processing protein
VDIDPAREQSILRALAARVLIPGDDEWPVTVEDHPEPPLCLWVKGAGDLLDLTERSVAIVGARAATAYGVHAAHELAAGVADREFTVVSGAAYGIDAAAHEGALAVDGTTVAVLAGGIDRAYPASHAGLLERVAALGVVVSEVAPGSAPTRWRFLSRNRIIAAVSRATVVVEAGLRSGSRNTAKHARGMGRPIAALPGPVTSAVSAGCHELIRGGATLVTDAAEVVELAGRIGELAPVKQEQATLVDELDAVQRRVFEAMPTRAPADLEALVRRSGLAGPQVRAAVGVLELGGLCERRPSGWRKAGEERKGVEGQI